MNFSKTRKTFVCFETTWFLSLQTHCAYTDPFIVGQYQRKACNNNHRPEPLTIKEQLYVYCINIFGPLHGIYTASQFCIHQSKMRATFETHSEAWSFASVFMNEIVLSGCDIPQTLTKFDVWHNLWKCFHLLWLINILIKIYLPQTNIHITNLLTWEYKNGCALRHCALRNRC